jgi:hypothetical protein
MNWLDYAIIGIILLSGVISLTAVWCAGVIAGGLDCGLWVALTFSSRSPATCRIL